jgi:hypothetical protein
LAGRQSGLAWELERLENGERRQMLFSVLIACRRRPVTMLGIYQIGIPAT